MGVRDRKAHALRKSGPVVQFGVHAALSRRRPRVQIPSGPQREGPPRGALLACLPTPDPPPRRGEGRAPRRSRNQARQTPPGPGRRGPRKRAPPPHPTTPGPPPPPSRKPRPTAPLQPDPATPPERPRRGPRSRQRTRPLPHAVAAPMPVGALGDRRCRTRPVHKNRGGSGRCGPQGPGGGLPAGGLPDTPQPTAAAAAREDTAVPAGPLTLDGVTFRRYPEGRVRPLCGPRRWLWRHRSGTRRGRC